MSFLSPLAFSLSALLPLIIVLYLLRLRRVERRVSSTYLWRRMVRDLEANAPWQRLRRNLLLFLQLLFLCALILALSRPYTWSKGFSGRSAILIVDTSASMAATDVQPSRLEHARQQINQLVGTLAQDIPVTLISAGIQARILSSSSLDRRQILQKIQELEVEMGSSDMHTALQLASAIAARQPETMIQIFTDGGVDLPANLNVNGRLNVVSIGSAGDNQAVNLMRLEPSTGGDNLSVFIQLVNYSLAEVNRRLKITVDGAIFQVADVTLPPRAEISFIANEIPARAQLIEAVLMPAEGPVDYLTNDDKAVAVNRMKENIKVNLITSGNRFLETALSLQPGIQLVRTDPSTASVLPDSDITIIDASLPVTTTLPAGSLFFIAPVHSTEFFTVTGTIDHPQPQPAQENLELLKYVSLSDVNILDATQMPLPDYAEPLIVASDSGSLSESPLLFIGEPGGRKLAVLAFSLQHSDLPLQVAFPLLLANLVQWLAGDRLNNIPVQVDPGSPVLINLPLGDSTPTVRQRVAITRPDGKTVEYQAKESQVVYADTTQTGIYEINFSEDDSIKFAVNLYSTAESDIQPAIPAPLASSETLSVSGSPPVFRQEWWRTLALAALVLLVLEWLVFHRSSLAYLVGKIKQTR